MGNGSFIPNSTQVHNVVLDVLLPFMREGERAVFLYIFRRTFGFNRHEDSIGLEQFEHGLITHEGKRLDYGCGMKRRVIIQALGFLMAAGIIERLEGGMGRTHISRYRMNVKESPLVQQLEEMQESNATPEQISQILHPFRKVADSALNTKKKSIKSKRSNVEINVADSAPIINVADSAPNTPIKGAENDTERVQKSNPQSIRENKTTENQKEDTPLPPQEADESERAPRGRNRSSYEDYPGFCELWDMAVIRPGGSKGIKQEALTHWKRLGIETDPVLRGQVLNAYAYQKTTRKWREDNGLYVKELQRWIKGKLWEGVTVPPEFDPQAQAKIAADKPKYYRDGDTLPDGTTYSDIAT